MPVGDATGIQILHEAGLLEVVGGAGGSEVAMVGTAYARSAADLADLQIVSSTDGATIVLEIKTPGDTRFDLHVKIPEWFGVVIDDRSGSITVRNVARLHLSDGSGSITARDIGGDFVVEEDGSGSISYSGVGGVVDIPAN